MAASSSSNSCNLNPMGIWKYHVFLSFRGEDTRNNFTDHLYAALWRKGIMTFRDSEQLERGQVINHQLLRAIEESLCAIVILSQNYASSSWCLDELQKILECRRALGRGVLPVFYGIDPSVVRHQTGSFVEAFRKHEERFREDKTKVQRWRYALSEVASLSGYHPKNQPETELIEEIIRMLWRRVESHLPSYSKDGLVGIDTKLEDMCQILEIGSSEVRFVGIWGMGGIGKTTLARIVFNQFRSHFDISCCLENVREKSRSVDGLLGLQMKLLSKLEMKDLEIDNLDQGKATLRNLLCYRKVLLLLDDVDDIRQLEYLAGKEDWFGQGSRVIVTTRDMHPLKSHDAQFREYEVELLNTDESHELFCQKAFKRNRPEKGYEEFTQQLVQYCQRLPLALRLLGLHFCGRDVSIWEDTFKKIKKDSPKDIFDTLRISFEGLEDAEKALFLEIACFFNGWYKDRVMQILESSGFNYKIGIAILIERSLLIYDDEICKMHDLLQEMGRKIVIQKSGYEISKQSRMWSPEDIDQVLKKNMGTEFIQSIVLEGDNYDGCWDPKAFLKTHNLRMLIISHGLPLPSALKYLPSSLKVIEWNKFPLKFVPSCLELNKLVELKMHHSKIKELWNGIQNFENLRFIDMSFSEDLIQIPNFLEAQSLESLILEGCSKLVEVHKSVGQLKKLRVLNLKDCINISCLPSKLETNSLEDFILSGCSKLSRLPEIMNANKAMVTLHLSGTAIKEVPSFVSCFQNLKSFSVGGYRKPIFNLWWKFWGNSGLMELKLPPLSSFPMLIHLDASYCNIRDESIPDDLSCLSSLETLDLSGNNFVSLPPSCISKLHRLWLMNLDHCPKLQSLPMFPPSLEIIEARYCGPLEPLPESQIWKLLMLDNKIRKRGPHGSFFYLPALVFPGNGIPVFFDKQKDVPLDDNRGLITVDIPYCCRSCGWWGIVLCLVVEPLITLADLKGKTPLGPWYFCHSFVAPETELKAGAPPTRYISELEHHEVLNRRHLFIKYLDHDVHKNVIQEVIRDGHDQFKLYFWISNSNGRFPCDEVKVKRCGWRVICQNEVRWRASISDFENHPPDSRESRPKIYCGKRSCGIIEVQDAIVSDDEPNPEHQQAQVQLRKLE